MRIYFQDKNLFVESKKTVLKIQKIEQLNIVLDCLKCYSPKNEPAFHLKMAMLDLLFSARNKLLKDREQECLKECLYIR